MIHIYVAVNSPKASDQNTGRSPTRPMKTLDAVIRKLAFDRISKPTIVHFASGTYTWAETLGPLFLREDLVFVGDGAGQLGDDGCTVLATGTCGGTTSLLTTTGLGVDTYMSKTVEIVATGDRRTIRSHTATDLVPDAAFTIAPSGTFRILEPAVIFQRPSFASSAVPSGPAIFGIGGQGTRAAQSHNNTIAPAFHLVNVRLTAAVPLSTAIVPFDIVDSSVVLTGVELIEGTSQFQTFAACGRSYVRAGWDYNLIGIQLVAPFKAGLVTNTTQWRGWGLTQPKTGSTAANIEVMYLSGYANLLAPAVIGGEWWLFGGSCVEISATVHALHARGGAKVTLGEWLPTRLGTPFLVRHGLADARVSCVCASGGALVNIVHALIEKTNTGLGIQAVGSDDHESTGVGMISVAGDTGLVQINGITGASPPSYGMFVRGGGRINWHDAYSSMTGWPTGKETAVGSRRLDQSPPDATHDRSDYTYDGASFTSNDGSVIERF